MSYFATFVVYGIFSLGEQFALTKSDKLRVSGDSGMEAVKVHCVMVAFSLKN